MDTFLSLLGPLALVIGAGLKLWANSQRKGALVVVALGLGQGAAFLGAYEELGVVLGVLAIGIAGVLLWAERRGRRSNRTA